MPSMLSLALVVAQFLLIAALASPLHGLLPDGVIALPGALLMGVGIALAGWAFVSLRRRNFTVLPEPRPGSELVESGPYASLRHPMYSAVLLCGFGAAWLHGTLHHALSLLLLAGVLLLKIRHEERLLLAAHPEYAAYQRRSSALIPGLY